jgi:hypothetical protein
MGLYFSTKLIGAILLIMSITYFAEGVVFAGSGDYSGDFSRYSSFSMSNVSVPTFNNWMNIQYYMVKDSTIETTNRYKLWRSDNAVTMLLGLRAADFNKFNSYRDGMHLYSQYETDWSLQNQFYPKSNWLKAYENWNSSGALDRDVMDIQGYNIIRQVPIIGNSFADVIDFVAKGLETIGKLMTFSITDIEGKTLIPTEVQVVLLVFFIPMYAILILEMLPVLAAVATAIKFW